MRMAASLPNQSPIHVPEGAASAPRQSADACVSPAVSLAADCGSFQQTLDRTIRFVQDDVFVDRSHLSVLHDDLAVNNGRFDVGSGGGVDDPGDRIDIEGRVHVEVVQVQDRHVGFLAEFQASDLLLQADGPGSANGSHTKDATGVHGRRAVNGLLNKRGQPHLVKHIQIVVARSPVGAQA